MFLTISNNACYQFNFYSGYDCIQGYIVDQDENFFKIKLKDVNALKTTFKPIDDIIYLSKNDIKYFFKVSEN